MGDTTTDVFDLCRLVRDRAQVAGLTVRSVVWRLGEVRATFVVPGSAVPGVETGRSVYFDEEIGALIATDVGAVESLVDTEIARAQRRFR